MTLPLLRMGDDVFMTPEEAEDIIAAVKDNAQITNDLLIYR
jgi:hypothetical protein